MTLFAYIFIILVIKWKKQFFSLTILEFLEHFCSTVAELIAAC